MRRPFPLLLLVLASAFAFNSSGDSDFPKIPPLPSSSWPSAEAAEPFARELLARVPPDVLARTLAAKPELIPPILRNLGTALMSSDPALRDPLPAYVSAVGRAFSLRTQDPHRLATIVVVDPLRYGEDGAFRERINRLLPRTVALMPPAVARAILNGLTDSLALDFDTAETVAAAAHIVARTSSERRIPFDRTKLEMPDDLSGPIEASIFSLSASYLKPPEVRHFLESLHHASPMRSIIVLGDTAMRNALSPHLKRLHVEFVDDYSRSFTPWTRDPFIVARSASGGVVFVNRPNVQPHREEDQNMVRAIVQELPRTIDGAWKNPRWTIAPTPFHNGHILLTPASVWISIHTVEPRALALLGLDRVPVETFNEGPGVHRYVEAARRAAEELQELYRRPVHFIHALPAAQPAGEASDLMNRLGGGAGFDLDSIVTILPRSNGKIDALVGDIALGVTAARQSSLAEWSAVRQAYGFRDEPEVLRNHVVDAQSAAQTIALQRFLDQVATDLQREGMRVRRLPLLNVPASLLAWDAPDDFAFLMTWNNVVLERRGEARRAEGFASLLASADRYAQQAFAASGYKLDLYPPLTRSMVLGGGYRCTSNHLRPLTINSRRMESPAGSPLLPGRAR